MAAADETFTFVTSSRSIKVPIEALERGSSEVYTPLIRGRDLIMNARSSTRLLLDSYGYNQISRFPAAGNAGADPSPTSALWSHEDLRRTT